jgi:hypothetical protein
VAAYELNSAAVGRALARINLQGFRQLIDAMGG